MYVWLEGSHGRGAALSFSHTILETRCTRIIPINKINEKFSNAFNLADYSTDL